MKGRKVMLAMSFIRPEYIYEGEFDTMPSEKNQPVKRHGRKLAVVLLAACLVFALAVTAYATGLFGLKDMYSAPLRELPSEAETYIQQQTAAAEAEDWSCEITESLADATTVMATVTIRGGDQYIIAPTYVGPDDSVSEIGLSGDQTLGEYAAAQGKKLLLVGASIKEVDGRQVGMGSQRMKSPSDHEMVILTQCTLTTPASGGNAICEVYARDAEDVNGEHVERIALPFTLNQAPATEELVYHVVNQEGIDFLRFGDVTFTQTALGYSIRMPVAVVDEDAFRNVDGWKTPTFAGFTYGEGGGFVGEGDTLVYQADMCQGSPGDTVTLPFTDWDGNPIGKIEFAK